MTYDPLTHNGVTVYYYEVYRDEPTINLIKEKFALEATSPETAEKILYRDELNNLWVETSMGLMLFK